MCERLLFVNRMGANMYDVVTSLGYNCEISFRIENFLGHLEAMPFSWSYENDRILFLDALENIELLFQGPVKLMDDNMICCERFNIKFHPRYSVLLRVGHPTEESYEECVRELRDRLDHLKSKFIDLLNSNKRTLFIVKVENNNTQDDVLYIKRLETVLKKIYASKNFKLLVVLEQTAKNVLYDELETEFIAVRYLKKFAPKKHTDTMGDTYGWFKILREQTGLTGKGYYKRLTKKRVSWAWSVFERRVLKRG